jgi:hypothetical protein
MRPGTSLFPGGFTGAGLLVLRFSVAFSVLALAARASFQPFILQCLATLAAVGLCAGFSTRALAVLSALASLLGSIAQVVSVEIALVHASFSVSLILAGPGAFSADARLFGRRTITLLDRDGSNTIE